MRFVRQEHIITTIINKKIVDTETTKIVLENLKKLRMNFFLVVRKYFQNDYTYHTVNYDKACVKKVKDTNVDFLIFNQSALTNIKNIDFANIIEIRAITEKNEILKTHPEISRFGLMDIEEDEEES